MKKIKLILQGFFIGCVNSLLGAGGGMLAVPILKKSGIKASNAHATSIAVILPITIVSFVIYVINGNVELTNAYHYCVPGLIGALIGTRILPQIPQKYLRKIFGGFMVWAAVRMMMR